MARWRNSVAFSCFDMTPKDMAPLLAVKNLSCVWPEGDPMFENVNFNVNEGDIIMLQARSGSGHVASVPVFLLVPIILITLHILVPSKTTLLKCIAHLYLYHGTVEFRGKYVAFLCSQSRHIVSHELIVPC
jgi:ABC-type iron transport system FetAB ATPase subunit